MKKNISVHSPLVLISDLSFTFAGSKAPAVLIQDLRLLSGSCYVLCGANGSGKSTFLQILAGKLMTKNDSVTVLGQQAFNCTSPYVCYVGEAWSADAVAFGGVRVSEILPLTASGVVPPRVASLVSLLAVDIDAVVHKLSKGQLRRVQLVCSLGARDDFLIYLLDEVTNDLDLVVRERLMQWLRAESEISGASVVLATHILQDLEDWAHGILFFARGYVELVNPHTLPHGIYKFVRDRLSC